MNSAFKITQQKIWKDREAEKTNFFDAHDLDVDIYGDDMIRRATLKKYMGIRAMWGPLQDGALQWC